MEPTRENPHLTCLYEGQMSEKSNPVIELRGLLDEVMALSWLIAAKYPGDGVVDVCAKEVAGRCQELLSAEYRGRCPGEWEYPLVGRPREMSHDPETYFGVPHFFGCELSDPALCHLNYLRTRVRTAERAAVKAFEGRNPEYIGLLNQMSSYVYCCMCLKQKRILEAGQ